MACRDERRRSMVRMLVSARQANGCTCLGEYGTVARDPELFQCVSGGFSRPGTARRKTQWSIQLFSACAWSHGPGSKMESFGVGGEMTRSGSSLVVDLASIAEHGLSLQVVHIQVEVVLDCLCRTRLGLEKRGLAGLTLVSNSNSALLCMNHHRPPMPHPNPQSNPQSNSHPTMLVTRCLSRGAIADAIRPPLSHPTKSCKSWLSSLGRAKDPSHEGEQRHCSSSESRGILLAQLCLCQDLISATVALSPGVSAEASR